MLSPGSFLWMELWCHLNPLRLLHCWLHLGHVSILKERFQGFQQSGGKWVVPTAGSWVIIMLNKWKGNTCCMWPAKWVTTYVICRMAESPSTQLVSLPSNLMASQLCLWWGYPATYMSEHLHIFASWTNPYSTTMTMATTEMVHISLHQVYKYHLVSSGQLQYHLIFICLQLPAIPFTVSMITQKKNKSAHPGIPDMMPSQLTSAGLSHTQSSHHSLNKKPMERPANQGIKEWTLGCLRAYLKCSIFISLLVSHLT